MMTDKLSYKFTNDTKLLKQYRKLRRIIYKIDLAIDVSEQADYFDDTGLTMVVRNKQRCIGGVRLNICPAYCDYLLPTESDDFRIKYLLPHMQLEQYCYAEFSRLVLLSDYRNSKVTEHMYKLLNKKARQVGVKYIFVITDRLHARLYMRSYKKLGYNVKLLENITLPDFIRAKYDYVPDCMIMLDLSASASASF